MIFAFSAAPFAKTITMSFVLVSLSTVTMLKVTSTISDNAFCKSFCSIEISVVIKQSIVAIFGCIIPEPFAIAPILTSLPPISISVAQAFE